MKITFLLPFFSLKPIGGFAVVYEYANRLVARGHKVTVVHVSLQPNTGHIRHLLRTTLLLTLTKKAMRRSAYILTEVPWFSVDSHVTLLQVPNSTARYIPDGDAIVFCGVRVECYPQEKGMKFHFIQGYRMGPLSPSQEDEAWREPALQIVIAQWLYEQALKLGVPADEMIHIPNGVDHSKYRILHPIEHRSRRIAMLYHGVPWKGSEDGIKALEVARERIPSLEAVFFSTYPRPERLPDWIEYHCNPPQEELVGSIYNGSSIYLCPSWVEGWHLPPAEAMACGCAVVSTDIGGVRDYAENDVTALLSPPKNPGALAENLLRLLEDDELRIKLAKAGHERIQEFTWERSTDLLEQFLFDRIGQPGTQEKL